MIDPATVERIKDAADIVDVVGDYVHLIRRGSNFMGLCPFHNERTPSFSVNRQRNFCYCFSCKKGGSPVNFIMEKEGLSYYEALMHLAKKYGIEVQERELTDEEKARQSEREAMFVANDWAMQKMEQDMAETEEGRDVGLQYLTQRGVTDAAMKAFHLGYALDKGNELTEAARKKGFDLEVFKKLGLVGTSQQGREYDRFRGRVIFPILNTAGKVIAFGGRDLKGGLAKYINSPESELYKKSNELYGIFQAKGSIGRENKCFLVEGYMDVIGMWQSGMKNVVASSGTALTDGQIAMIHRFTDNITLIYDGDAAGIKASLRGIDMLLSHKMNVKVMLLPDGDDPDSFARKHTPEEFRNYVEEHETDIIRFKAQVMLNEMRNDPQKRILAINSVVNSIAHIPDNVSRDVYVQECSLILNIAEATIAKAVAKARAEIVEKIKKERLRKEYPVKENPASAQPQAPAQQNETPQAAPSGQPTATLQPAPAAATPQAIEKQPKTTTGRNSLASAVFPLYPLEKSVIKYCIRYAYLNFCSYEEMPDETNGLESPQIVSLDVLDFVREEIHEANISFTVPIFSKIFEMLIDLRPGFESFLNGKMPEIDKTITELRQQRYDEIASKSMSGEEIRREEKKLEEELAFRREKAIKEVTKEYPGRILGSDEDEEVRKMTLELILEKHHLSNIYMKEGNTEQEEDRLSVLLVRAIDEWKNEIINLKIKELLKAFNHASLARDREAQTRIQTELNTLLATRKEMSKYIGERTLSNR